MKTFITLAAATLVTLGANAARNIDLNTLASQLSEMSDFAGSATFDVLLPTSDEPVVYHMKMASTACHGDTLAPAAYLIDWRLDRAKTHSEGFSAYFDGNHYRYRDRRLQEYHVAEPDDAPSFAPGGDESRGVQNQAQFCDLLPQYLGRTLASMDTDSTYKYAFHADTVISGQRTMAVDGVRSFGGVDGLEFLYVFDSDLLPLKAEMVSNPGQIGEQVISVVYDYSDEETLTVATSEDELAERYPEAFGRYRERTFSLDNLPGRRLPDFTAPTLDSDRYVFTRDTELGAPTLIAILDADDPSAGAVIGLIRESAGKSAGVIYAFVSNNISKVEPLVGEIRRGETALVNARGLARDCGVKETPVIIMCDSNGIVKDLHRGFNNELRDFVIKMSANTAE